MPNSIGLSHGIVTAVVSHINPVYIRMNENVYVYFRLYLNFALSKTYVGVYLTLQHSYKIEIKSLRVVVGSLLDYLN